MTWILILTIFPAMGNGGSAIASVPGFQTESECITAARVWVDAAKTGYPVRAVCVQQKKP